MYLSHLSLTNFRGFSHLELDLPPGVVVLSGENAQGKTTLLEAMYLLAIARSFRAENEYEVVNWRAYAEGADALVGGTIERGSERFRVYVGYQCVPVPEQSTSDKERPFTVRKQIRVSRLKRTAAQLVGAVNAVLFTADDIELVQGPPSLRRRYLDILLSQVDPAYLKYLQRYQKVLQQRNRLLKLLQERRAETQELDFWDQELVKEGAWIIGQRYRAMGLLASLSRESHGDLTGGGEELALEYRPSVLMSGESVSAPEAEGEFMAAIAASRKKEIGVGSTTVGPHRDDFHMMVNGVDMGTYASRGQARTLALSLRLAEAAYLASARDERPIVLLDDVLSEMDASRRSRVLDRALGYQQVIISTTDPDLLQATLPSAAYFQLSEGRVREWETPTYSQASG